LLCGHTLLWVVLVEESLQKKAPSISTAIRRGGKRAFQRAGYSEEKAVEMFSKLQDWLSGVQKPTISQLQTFASKFSVLVTPTTDFPAMMSWKAITTARSQAWSYDSQAWR